MNARATLATVLMGGALLFSPASAEDLLGIAPPTAEVCGTADITTCPVVGQVSFQFPVPGLNLNINIGLGRQNNTYVCFYTDTNYSGDRWCINGNRTYNSLPDDWDNAISSVRSRGSNVQVKLCRWENQVFCTTFSTPNIPRLSDYGLNNNVSSLRVTGNNNPFVD